MLHISQHIYFSQLLSINDCKIIIIIIHYSIPFYDNAESKSYNKKSGEKTVYVRKDRTVYNGNH